MKWLVLVILVFSQVKETLAQSDSSWIRFNQLGYSPMGIKIAVWCSKTDHDISSFELVDDKYEVVFKGNAGRPMGAYGPFEQTYRLDFSAFKTPGRYFLRVGNTSTGLFIIGKDVYSGFADFCLRYMRQQRTGFNPYLEDSCHTRDGYVLYGQKAGIADSTAIDVVGGWHDASDYLQYSSTSANATYHLLMAYRDFPEVFIDKTLANGLKGKNGVVDILDEARWGLDWLLKMHPRADWMFNQIADDRDHRGMRMPGLDSFYGRGHERPVYFVSGEPQQRGKYMNHTTGTSSTAGKFTSAFALGSEIFGRKDPAYSIRLREKALSSFYYGMKHPGVTQTASVVSPYIYAEENWVDDIELANAALGSMASRSRSVSDQLDPWMQYQGAYASATNEKITPWLGNDTAAHYQWYPFINVGHYETAKGLKDEKRDSVISWYRQGIQLVWEKAGKNAFYRGVPFIWCSNNLTVAFAMQCMWYRELTGDKRYEELEQANFDWLFGCNPWGTSMVYGLPSDGDTPVDPHSAFTHIKNYPIDGGLVDGPVYGSIFKSLIGIQLKDADEYAQFQSDLAVYHDDYGDYSTNEPTMDGTASLVYLLAAKESAALKESITFHRGAIIRGDSSEKRIALVFTGHEFAEGRDIVANILQNEKIAASFFFTGDYYRNPNYRKSILKLKENGHYLGAHSDKHLLYCDWTKRDSLLITKEQFISDMEKNFAAMDALDIDVRKADYYLPPYEWYNDTIAKWAREEMNLKLISFTPGTKSQADYTWPELPNYINSENIYQSILEYEKSSPSGLNGFILLMHLGTDPARQDKFYTRLPSLIRQLRKSGYRFLTVEDVLRYGPSPFNIYKR